MRMFSMFDTKAKEGGLIERRAYLKFLLDKGDLIERGLNREGGLNRAFAVIEKSPEKLSTYEQALRVGKIDSSLSF